MKKNIEIETKKTELSQDKYSNNLWFLFLNTNLMAMSIAFVMLLITAIGIGIWGYSKLLRFEKSAGITLKELKNTVQIGLEQNPTETNNHKNILLLGVDSVVGRGDVPPLTDTIMLISLNLKTGEINTLPLPRDLWSEKYQTKINALYFYGLDRYPNEPEKFTQETIEELTDTPIHHTIVLSLDKLEELIDSVNGVTIDIPKGFIDPEFPRSGVDVTVERDPAILYETVEFKAGTQTLSGERALKYIRSRHSEGDEGTDISRGERQQIVIKALFTQLLDLKQYVKEPELAGALYKFYETSFSEVFPLEEIVSTVKTIIPVRENIMFSSHQLSTTKDNPQTGALDNPRPSYIYQNQWVYTINNEDLFRQEIKEALF